jgi:DNA-binding response OmpR family regulator
MPSFATQLLKSRVVRVDKVISCFLRPDREKKRARLGEARRSRAIKRLIMATILVVEDELDVQKVVAKRLSSRGFTVHCASDGYQAVQLAHKVNPDLIVLDLQLPAGDGLSVLRKVRMSGNVQRARIVVLTGMTNEIYKQSILAEGVDAYLQKPYDSQVLLDTIDQILGKKENPPDSETPKAGPASDEPTLFDFAQSRNQAGK